MVAMHWSRLGIAATIAVALAPAIAGAATTRHDATEHTATSPCAANALTVLTWSNFAAYAPATPVALTTTVRNSGPVACRATFGGTSPLVTVRGANGSVAWSSCGVTPCPMYLVVMTLAPGASRVTNWKWNQRIGGRVAPRGTYTVETAASGVTSRHSATIRLGTRSVQPTVVVGPGDNVRRVTLSRGATLIVRLAPRSLYVWSAPTGSPLLATRLSLGGTSLLAQYVARAAGSAVVRAVATPSCYPLCMLPSQLYELQVTITN